MSISVATESKLNSEKCIKPPYIHGLITMKFISVGNLITHITRTHAYHAREKKYHSFQHIGIHQGCPCLKSFPVKEVLQGNEIV